MWRANVRPASIVSVWFMYSLETSISFKRTVTWS